VVVVGVELLVEVGGREVRLRGVGSGVVIVSRDRVNSVVLMEASRPTSISWLGRQLRSGQLGTRS